MKAIKLIIIFVVVLGGVLGAIFLVTSGGTDVPVPSPDTNVLPDTTTTEDSANSSAPLPGAQEENEVDPNREMDKTENTQTDKTENTQTETTKSSTGNTQRKFTCEKCGPSMWFNTNTDLKHHMKAKHKSSTGGKASKFACDKCDESFNSYEKLQMHKMIIRESR